MSEYCANCKELADQLALAKQRAERAEAALLEIKTTKGKVCSNFELCTHESCLSSYSAWAIADMALASVESK